jgi:hypothetical protein
LKYLFLSLLFFYKSSLFAGSCCGGGAGTTQLMLGSTKSVWRVQMQEQNVLADTNAQGKIIPRTQETSEAIRTYQISTSHAINELWQMGLVVPWIEKFRFMDESWQSEQGLGDLSVNLGYEFYPEYSRHQFITQAFWFLQITLPTAPSLFTTNRLDLLDTRGQGHTLYSTGLLLNKRLRTQQVVFQASVTYRENETFDNGVLTKNLTIKTSPSIDHNLNISHSYFISDQWSTHFGISRTYIENKASSVFIGEKQSSLVYPVIMGLIYGYEQFDFSLLYQDDMIVGPSFNHVLGRSVSLGIIKRVNL